MATTMRPSWYEWRDAIAGRDFATAAATIQIDPALIKTTNGIGETALHFLAVENDAMGVAWLDEQGADINCENDFGIPAWLKWRSCVTANYVCGLCKPG